MVFSSTTTAGYLTVEFSRIANISTQAVADSIMTADSTMEGFMALRRSMDLLHPTLNPAIIPGLSAVLPMEAPAEASRPAGSRALAEAFMVVEAEASMVVEVMGAVVTADSRAA
jgi:hypothetical protein